MPISFLAHLFPFTQQLQLHREDPQLESPYHTALEETTFRQAVNFSSTCILLQSLKYLGPPKKRNINVHIIENRYVTN